MFTIIRSSIILLLIFCDVSVGLNLKFLNILFRHGDRTPSSDPYESFRTSPYVNSTFEPYGLGQLTNRGKQREYDLGKHIRKQYNDFLGDLYHPGAVISHSSDFDRTKMSLQLVLAGMFPPAPSQQWNPSINWQPVVANYLRRDEDLLLFAIDCPRHKQEFKAALELPEVKKEISKFDDLAKNLEQWIGAPINDTKDFLSLYNGLMSLKSMGLDLPPWTSGIFPNGALSQAAALHYRIMNYNNRLKTLNGGMVIKNFTDNMLRKINGDGPAELKVVVLSGHETHMGSLMGNLVGFKDQVPQYSSAIFVELLEENNEYYVSIFYYLGIPAVRKATAIPGCEELCPFQKFVGLYEGIFPSKEDMLC